MNLLMYVAAAALIIFALALVVVPLLKYRTERGVGATLTVLVIALPLAVAGLYAMNSSYPWEDPSLAAEADRFTQNNQPAVDEMITELALRLQANPDPEGYVLLARSYIQLQRYADAVDAWHKAWELTAGENPDIALGYAEALVLADQRTLKTGAADLLDEVLLIMPDDARALWYGGLSSAARGRNNEAVDRFSRLLSTDLPPDFRSAVQMQLAQLGTLPATDDAGNVANSAPAAVDTRIQVTITIDPEIAALATPDATLFVFAREAKRPGPPAAVKRIRAGQLPMTIDLSDADAMTAGSRLTDVSELKIVARLSASGNAIAAAGDLYGEAFPMKSAAGFEAVTIVINTVQ